MDLSIVIVSWNVAEKLKENLKNLFQSKTDYKFEVFVVDNNSVDDTVSMIKKDFPEVKLIANDNNLGFSKANNQAIKKSQGDFILLLNPDMKVQEDTIDNMITWMKNNGQASLAGCRLIDESGMTIKHVRNFPTLGDQLAIVLKLPHLITNILDKYLRIDFNYQKAEKVDSIRGGFFMLRRSDFQNILSEEQYINLEVLDERYFIWFEEVDFCKSVARAGKEVWYTPEAICVDYVGQSFNQLGSFKKQRYFRDSMLKYFKKWHPSSEYFILYIAWIPMTFLAFMASLFGFKNKKHNT